MRNPLIADVRRIRAKLYRERLKNPNYVAESQELLRKVCDVVVSENGETHYVTNREKLYEVLIAPRLAKKKRSVRSQPATPAG